MKRMKLLALTFFTHRLKCLLFAILSIIAFINSSLHDMVYASWLYIPKSHWIDELNRTYDLISTTHFPSILQFCKLSHDVKLWILIIHKFEINCIFHAHRHTHTHTCRCTSYICMYIRMCKMMYAIIDISPRN